MLTLFTHPHATLDLFDFFCRAQNCFCLYNVWQWGPKKLYPIDFHCVWKKHTFFQNFFLQAKPFCINRPYFIFMWVSIHNKTIRKFSCIH